LLSLSLDERRLAPDDGRVDEPADLEKADARVPVPEHHRVAQHQVEQRARRRLAAEVLAPDRLERRGGEPLDVVLPVGRVRPDRARLGERNVVDDRPFQERALAVEELLEDRRLRVRIGAEPCEEVAAAGLQVGREEAAPERAELEDELVVELVEALRVALVILDGAGVQADDVEQRLVRVAGAADVRDARGHPAPVAVHAGEQRVQALEVGRAAFAPALRERAIARERHRREDAVGLVADPNAGQGPAAGDVAGEEGARRRQVVLEEGRQHLLELVAERRRPERDVHRPRLALVAAGRVRDDLEQRVVDPERLGEPLAVAALERVVVLGVGVLALEDDVVRGVRVVGPRVCGALGAGVVRRASLRDEAEAVGARVVVRDERREEVAALRLVRRDPHAEDEQAVEPGCGLRRG